ncbi:MAG: thioredoxin family protein [Thermoguttaceae bacterium]|nr:thioredoxin family protein [Thermoguttaceae bacterium]
MAILKKLAFYGLSLAALLALAYFTQRGELKFPDKPVRAEVSEESEPGSERVDFLADYDEALRQASSASKPVLIFFMAKNCRYSAKMLDGAFADPRVERLAKRFVCVRVDMGDPANDALCDEYGVAISPTVQFVDPSGALLQRFSAEQSGDQLAERMAEALASSARLTARAEARALLR